MTAQQAMSVTVREARETSDPSMLVKEPLVSVHMITYNHGRYLRDAIESVIHQQTGFPFELIVGEDCSTDETRRVALDLQRRYPTTIRVVHSESNVGARANSERVLTKARGKYVAFCEGDDYWHNLFKLQKQVSFLEQHPDYVLVHSGFRVQIGQTIVSGAGMVPVTVPSGDVFETLMEANFIATCTVCMRRDVAADYFASQFRTERYLMDDYPHWLFASRQGAIGYIDEPLATYRCIAGSAMRRTPDAALRMELSARQVRADFAQEYACRAEVLSSALRKSNRIVLRMAVDLADRERFLQEYRWYRKNDPSWRCDGEMAIRFIFFKLGLFRAARHCRRWVQRIPIFAGHE